MNQDSEIYKDRISKRFMMTETSMQRNLRETESSVRSREDIRVQIKLYKKAKEQLRCIHERVNSKGAEQRSPEELHDIMSLLRDADRVAFMIKNILKYIKDLGREQPEERGTANQNPRRCCCSPKSPHFCAS